MNQTHFTSLGKVKISENSQSPSISLSCHQILLIFLIRNFRGPFLYWNLKSPLIFVVTRPHQSLRGAISNSCTTLS